MGSWSTWPLVALAVFGFWPNSRIYHDLYKFQVLICSSHVSISEQSREIQFKLFLGPFDFDLSPAIRQVPCDGNCLEYPQSPRGQRVRWSNIRVLWLWYLDTVWYCINMYWYNDIIIYLLFYCYYWIILYWYLCTYILYMYVIHDTFQDVWDDAHHGLVRFVMFNDVHLAKAICFWTIHL